MLSGLLMNLTISWGLLKKKRHLEERGKLV